MFQIRGACVSPSNLIAKHINSAGRPTHCNPPRFRSRLLLVCQCMAPALAINLPPLQPSSKLDVIGHAGIAPKKINTGHLYHLRSDTLTFFFCGESSPALPFSSLCHGSCVFASLSSSFDYRLRSKVKAQWNKALPLRFTWKMCQCRRHGALNCRCQCC